MTHLWLIGMMGTGKSTIGRLIGEELQLPFIDVDCEITTSTGRTIEDLFAEGEAVFRNEEAMSIRRISQRSASVIATGGGAVLDPQNVAVMRGTGSTVLLTAAPDELIERITTERGVRPLVGSTDDIARIALERDAVYLSAAKFSVDTTGKDLEAVVSEVIQCVDM